MLGLLTASGLELAIILAMQADGGPLAASFGFPQDRGRFSFFGRRTSGKEKLVIPSGGSRVSCV